MKKIVIILLLFVSKFQASTFAASILRSDTIDIRKTTIDMNILDFVGKQLQAKSTLDIKAKLGNINTLYFDLEGLIVDSTFVNGSVTPFVHANQTLAINLINPLSVNDSVLVSIYYHGIPIADATWGGFSFIGNYGFQMGVGFNAQPHSFGRTWHPCFDNFVERSQYEFFITTEDTKKAMCNGLFVDSTVNSPNTMTWHWKLDEEIPSYLASVAVCNYVIVTQTLNGNNGTTPAEIACEPADINKVNGSFANLQQSFTMLENKFGTYSWPKVGYTLVPFNAGAMEHATNIHIGRPFIDGTLNYETLIAHELSHHWWGDLVTCSTAGDMWLNEGWASYCEYLHLEHMYGYDAYIKAIRDNHFEVISNAHIRDDGYRAIANMDSLHTYGSTVYLKGADAIHSLRTYLGDNDFFAGSQAFLNAHKFKAINSEQLRNFLTNYSGKDMNPYFANWIFAPGFTNFTIDSMQVNPIGSQFDVSLFIRQRKHKSNDYYSNVPLEVGFYENHSIKQIVPFTFSGRCMQLKVTLPFSPKMTILDSDFKLSDAVTEDWKTLKTVGSTVMDHAKCRVRVKSVLTAGDSATIRIEHHWVAPDRFKNPQNANGYVLQDSRYWKVDGINLQNFTGWIQFNYSKSASDNYIDSTWLKNSEDSIRLFYRQDARQEWTFANDSLVAGNLNDGIGSIISKDLKTGEFCIGIKRSNFIDPLVTDAPFGGCQVITSIKEFSIDKASPLSVRPNPNQGQFSIKSPYLNGPFMLDVFNSMGNKIEFNQAWTKNEELMISLKQPIPGIYFIRIMNSKTHHTLNAKFLIE